MVHNLHSNWVVYYHTFSDDWSVNSYNELCIIKTIEDYWQFMNNLPDLSTGMFFIMREGISPTWEDPQNINGGAWTLFISNNQVDQYFINISAYMVCENLVESFNSKEITGISITPKHKSFSIKIWNKSRHNHKQINFNNDVNLIALNYKQHK